MKKLERCHFVASVWKNAATKNPCISTPNGNGWTLSGGIYQIKWYDGDQLPVDIYKALKSGAQPILDEEMEDEEVSHGESVYGPDEVEEDYDDML